MKTPQSLQATAGPCHDPTPAQQLDFLQVLTNHLVENGSVSPKALFDSPYNEPAPSGPDILFGEDRVALLFGILRSIEGRARVS